MSDPAQSISSTDVLIVGGGPVGLALAIDLGWRGVRCLLVERRDGRIQLPKMNMVSGRTMEFCRRWGIADEVVRLSVADDFPRNILFVTSANGYEIARFEYPARRDMPYAHSPVYLQRCSQLLFDPLLRRTAAAQAHVAMRYETAVVDFAEDDAGVSVTLEDAKTGRTESVHTRYVVGCDGADSFVRERLGIPLVGAATLSHSANIFFRTNHGDALMPRGKAMMQWLIDADGYWGGIISVDGDKLWRIGVRDLRAGQSFTTEEAAAVVRKAAGRDFEFDVLSVLPWTRRSVIAQRYRQGRVFLAGDAAHQLSPTGGFGMNTGLGDAIDLSWKLAATIEGWGGAHLLDSYERERKPIGDLAISEGGRNFAALASISSGPEIVDDTQAGEILRRKLAHHIYANDFHREYESDGLTFGYHYEGSPIVWTEDGTAPRQMVTSYRPTARAGHRAPHVWVDTDQSSLDLFGPSYTLVSLNGSSDAAAGLLSAATACNMPLRLAVLDSQDARGVYERQLVLVRPDGHVAWRGDAAPDDPVRVIDRVRGAGAEGSASA